MTRVATPELGSLRMIVGITIMQLVYPSVICLTALVPTLLWKAENGLLKGDIVSFTHLPIIAVDTTVNTACDRNWNVMGLDIIMLLRIISSLAILSRTISRL